MRPIHSIQALGAIQPKRVIGMLATLLIRLLMFHFLYTNFSITPQCEKGQDYTGLSVSKGIHRYVSLERGYMTSWGIHDVAKMLRRILV